VERSIGGRECMTEVPLGITARRLIKALHQDGFVLKRTRGSHRIYRHPDSRRVVVAYHGLNDTFPIGTLRAMLSDVGWGESDLRRLGLLRDA
jgi:predicted RNA binding protein YcfA (HicA-like mRNA interferase family)